MSETNEWCVVVYDKPGTDRMSVFDQHVKSLPNVIEGGIMITGGQINDDSDPRKPIGSSLTIRAKTKEDVIKILKNDAFYKNGIWDVDNALIYHLYCVYREELIYQL